MSSDTFKRLEMSFILVGMRCFVCSKPLENFGHKSQCQPSKSFFYTGQAVFFYEFLLEGFFQSLQYQNSPQGITLKNVLNLSLDN